MNNLVNNNMARPTTNGKNNGSALEFEAQLWAAADKMRGHMDASEYKHVCLGLIFLKYISDAFEEKREQLLLRFADPKSDWFIKDEAQRPEAADERDQYIASMPFSASDGEKVAAGRMRIAWDGALILELLKGADYFLSRNTSRIASE